MGCSPGAGPVGNARTTARRSPAQAARTPRRGAAGPGFEETQGEAFPAPSPRADEPLDGNLPSPRRVQGAVEVGRHHRGVDVGLAGDGGGVAEALRDRLDRGHDVPLRLRRRGRLAALLERHRGQDRARPGAEVLGA